MRPSKSTAALAAILVILSYSITTACDHRTEQARKTVEAVNVESETAGNNIDVTISCELLDKALVHGVLIQAHESSSRATASARSSIRAGVNLTRALSRAMVHLAVAVARTAYHTVTALT
jgi:hypothetical protein